jgi:cytochrome b subunit of formate dehydrogenase/cytochrome c5
MPNDKQYRRFDLSVRVEHWILVLAFTTLAVTGLPQKFAGDAWAETLIALMGGIEMVRTLHHVAAAILMVESVYHLMAVAYRIFVLRTRWTMFPGMPDVKEAVDAVLYNLGIGKNPPQADRYSFAEKAEYWALIWGTALMGFTGFMLWNPIITSQFVPGDAIPAAKAAHGGEAILAVLAIIVWHLYNVHIKTFNQAMFTGKLSAHAMNEEHGLELARIESRQADWQPKPEQRAQWHRIFLPIATIFGIVLLGGVLVFLLAETTAVTTVPKPSAQVQVYAPRTPTPTRTPTRAATLLPGQTVTPEPTKKPSTGPGGLPATHAGRTVCQVCHVTGVGGAPKNPADHVGRLDAGCVDCHKPK